MSTCFLELWSHVRKTNRSCANSSSILVFPDARSSLDPTNYGLTSTGANAAYAASVVAANANIQTTLTQGVALISGKILTAAAERAVLASVAKKYIKSAPKASVISRRRLQQASSTSTVDLTNSTVVADLLTQAIATAQASGAISAVAAATAQSSVAVVAVAVSNINAAVGPVCVSPISEPRAA